MPLTIDYQHGGNALHVLATGQLTKDDYERWVPEIETILKNRGDINVLFEMRDFDGWDAGAFWEDVKFDVKHFNDVGRVALLGAKTWEKVLATLCKPFTTAEVRFFEPEHVDEARRWVGLIPANAAVH